MHSCISKSALHVACTYVAIDHKYMYQSRESEPLSLSRGRIGICNLWFGISRAASGVVITVQEWRS